MRFAVNCSIVVTELPPLDGPEPAKSARFECRASAEPIRAFRPR